MTFITSLLVYLYYYPFQKCLWCCLKVRTSNIAICCCQSCAFFIILIYIGTGISAVYYYMLYLANESMWRTLTTVGTLLLNTMLSFVFMPFVTNSISYFAWVKWRTAEHDLRELNYDISSPISIEESNNSNNNNTNNSTVNNGYYSNNNNGYNNTQQVYYNNNPNYGYGEHRPILYATPVYNQVQQ